MAGTVTVTPTFDPDVYQGPIPKINRIVLAWTSSAGGAADGTIAINGTIRMVQFIPGAGGAAPSAAYDLVLTDAAGIDVLDGAGANLSESAASSVVPVVDGSDGTSFHLRVVAETLTLAVTNAGDANTGQVVIYVQQAA